MPLICATPGMHIIGLFHSKLVLVQLLQTCSEILIPSIVNFPKPKRSLLVRAQDEGLPTHSLSGRHCHVIILYGGSCRASYYGLAVANWSTCTLYCILSVSWKVSHCVMSQKFGENWLQFNLETISSCLTWHRRPSRSGTKRGNASSTGFCWWL